MLLIIIILAAVGNKSKPLGVVKSIFTLLLALAIGLLSVKYIGDAGTEKILSPGIGLYVMVVGGFLMAIFSVVPTKFLPPCFLHKLMSKPKEVEAPATADVE
jgi:hypothetical protein